MEDSMIEAFEGDTKAQKKARPPEGTQEWFVVAKAGREWAPASQGMDSQRDLDVQADIGLEPLSVGGLGVGGIGALRTSTGTGTVGGPITLTGKTMFGSEGTLNIDGTLTAAGNGLTTMGNGVVNFGTTSTLSSLYSLTVTGGTTNVNSTLGAAGTAEVVVDGVGSPAKLRFGSVSQTLGSLTIGAGATVVFTSGAASGSLTGDDGGGKAAGFGSPASSFGGGATVPEPGTLGLLLVGALGMLNRPRRA